MRPTILQLQLGGGLYSDEHFSRLNLLEKTIALNVSHICRTKMNSGKARYSMTLHTRQFSVRVQ